MNLGEAKREKETPTKCPANLLETLMLESSWLRNAWATKRDLGTDQGNKYNNILL